MRLCVGAKSQRFVAGVILGLIFKHPMDARVARADDKK
jgi:hypothetical protein